MRSIAQKKASKRNWEVLRIKGAMSFCQDLNIKYGWEEADSAYHACQRLEYRIKREARKGGR